jgi:hypothetical protein
MVGSCALCSSSHDAKLHDRKHRCRNACTTPHPGAQTPEGTVRALADGPLVARAGSGRPEGATYRTVSSVAEGLQRGPPADGSKIAGAHAETARPDTAGQGYPPGCDARLPEEAKQRLPGTTGHRPRGEGTQSRTVTTAQPPPRAHGYVQVQAQPLSPRGHGWCWRRRSSLPDSRLVDRDAPA